ncbi:MAG: hypothetical protein V3V95_03480 [Thermodesulfobacteriota bacterium]
MSIFTGKFKLDRLLLSLIIIQIIIDLPFFFDLVLLQHDTQYLFQRFYLSYNDFFFFNELPRWVPFGSYGIQGDFITLLPTEYLSVFIGRVLGIENVLSLFKLSIFFQQMIFLFGLYLLAQRLFERPATVFFVSVTTICSIVFYFQLYWNFLGLICLPLILYFIHRFFCDHKLRDIMIMMNILILSVFGSAVYIFTLTAMVVAVFFITMLIAHIGRWRSFLSISKRDLCVSGLLLLVFAALLGTFYFFITNAMNFTEGLHIGRDSVTKVSSLPSFLGYADETIGFEKFIGLLYPALEFIILDLTLHVGFLSLLFIGYALIFVRNAAFIAMAAVVTVFVLFSLGSMTPVAEFLYNYFPTMKYYRHIGNSVANLKLFLPFMAGFGLDHILCRFQGVGENSGRDGLWSPVLKISTAIVLLVGSFIYSSVYSGILDNGHLGLWMGVTVGFLVLLYLLNTRLGWARGVGFFIAACVLFQMLGYRTVVDTIVYIGSRHNVPQEISLKVNRYAFQPERTLAPSGARSAATLFYAENVSVQYTLAYSFIQWDPCVSAFRTDLLNENVAALLRARGVSYSKLKGVTGGMRLRLPYDPGLFSMLGCMSPKLKLFSDVLFVDDPGAAEAFVRRGDNAVLVLGDVPPQERNAWSASASGERGKGTIEVGAFSSNRLELDVDISSEGGQWLYYADAWHPGWKVFVNGVPKPVSLANIAFKAVRLDKGQSKVSFVFDNSKSRVLVNLMVFYGIFFVLLLFIFFCVNLLRSTEKY